MAKQNSSGWLDQFVSKVPKTFGKEVAKTDATTQSKPGPVFLGNPYAKEMAKRQTYLNPKGVSASDAMRQAAKDRIAKEKADAFTRELAETAQTVGAGFELASPFLGPLAPITAAVGAGFGIGSSAYLAAKDAAAGNYSSAALNAGFGALDAAGLAALRNAKLKDFVQGADNVSDFQQVVDLTDVGSSLDDKLLGNAIAETIEGMLPKKGPKNFVTGKSMSSTPGTLGTLKPLEPHQEIGMHAVGDLDYVSDRELKEAYQEALDKFQLTNYRPNVDPFLDHDVEKALAMNVRMKFADRLPKFTDNKYTAAVHAEDPLFFDGRGVYSERFFNQQGYDLSKLNPQDRTLMDAYQHGYDSYFSKRPNVHKLPTTLKDYFGELSDQFNAAVQKNKINKDITLNRSVGNYTIDLLDPVTNKSIGKGFRDELQVGDVYKEPGFLSTSLPHYMYGGGKYTDKIIVPGGGVQSYAFPNATSYGQFMNEQEVILPKGLIRRVEDVPEPGQVVTSILNPYKNGGWLDKYNDGGPVQPNYNDASVLVSKDFVGDGYSNVGRNYSPAWGGQFKNGGKVCDSCEKAQEGKKVSGDEKRKRALAKAEEVFANSANPYTIPESVVKAGGNSNYVCIQGVCGILSDAGLIPKDYYTNTKFAEKAKDLGFGRAMADINLIKPGDVVQHMSDQNDAGVRFPSHAEMFKRVNPDTGEYEFYDYFDKYNGLGGIRTYSKDELEERFGRFKNRDNSGIQAQFFSLDPESLPQKAPQPFPYNLPQKEQEQYFNATHVANTKYYPGDAAQGPILDVPSYERSQTKHELTDLFNDKKLDDKLRKELKITDQDLQKAKPLIYGIMDQETDFGNPKSVGRNIKYGLKELLGSGQYSMGPSAVRYDEALSDEAKKAFGINSPKDLSKVKNAYIGALDVLSKGARYTDNNVSGHPGLEDKDRMERALYWYNNPSNVVNSDAETFQAISRKANNLFPWQDKQEMMSKAYNSPLEMSVGSYPDKVLKQSKGLHQVIDFNDMNVLPEVRVVAPKDEVVQARGEFAMGGSMPGATGHFYARYSGGGSMPGDADYNAPRTGQIPNNGKYAKKTKASAQNGTEMRYYQEGLDFKPKTISKDGGWLSKYEEGGVIQDDMGQWAHPGEITQIGSNQITMQGVPYPVLGISDTGDTQMMYPNQEYQYDGSSVTEYPIMKQGGQLKKLDQLTNFTNYNPTKPSGWLDKYQ